MGFSIGHVEHTAKKDTVKVGVPGGGQPAQPQALIECPVERVGGFRLTNQGDTGLTYQLCCRGKVRSVSGEVLAGAGVTSVRGLLAFKKIIPGTVVIVETAAANETFTDPAGDGVLVGDQGGSGTIDYETGLFDITFAAISTGNTTAAYDTNGWERVLSTGLLAAGGGGKYEELEPAIGETPGPSWADIIKGHTHVGIEAYCTLSGDSTLLEVKAVHFGDDSEFKLDLPLELGGNLNTTY